MINNTARIGNFTSSEIVELTKKATDRKSFGVKALTYIKQTNMERRLGRALDGDTVAKPLTWGKLLEGRVFELLGLEYTLSSTVTDLHPVFPNWAGSKDGLKHDQDRTVADIKCPITLESFCNLVDPIYQGLSGIDAMNAIRDNHGEGDKYYFQLVSNAIINGCRYAELIVYMPYQSELADIKLSAQIVSGELMSRHYWIAMAGEDELPFIKDGGYYKNLNVIRFEVPEEDRKMLVDCVKKASALLIPWPGSVSEGAFAKVLPVAELEDANALKI